MSLYSLEVFSEANESPSITFNKTYKDLSIGAFHQLFVLKVNLFYIRIINTRCYLYCFYFSYIIKYKQKLDFLYSFNYANTFTGLKICECN